MLAAAFLLCLTAADAEDPLERLSMVQLQLGLQSGGLYGDTDRALAGVARGVPAVLGAQLGVRAWRRPPFVEGGSRFSFNFGVEGHYAFHARKVEWIGRFGLGGEIGRISLIWSTGFGFSWMPAAGLRPVVPIGFALLVRLDSMVLGVGYDRMFQLNALSRGIGVAAIDSRILFTVSKELDLAD